MEQNPRTWLSALRTSHEGLAALARSLSPEQLKAQSYCRDWDVSQVLSHLGSGAEIFLHGLEAALDDRPSLGRDQFPAIWGRWDAMSPTERAAELVVWDRRHISVFEALDDATLSSLRGTLFGLDVDGLTMLGFRLPEHTLHSWDVAVSFDPGAELLAQAVPLVLERVPFMAARAGKPDAVDGPRHLAVYTAGPEVEFVLDIDSDVRLEARPVPATGADGALRLPAAALIRLVFGRLDPDHTPAGVRTEGSAELDELRKVFAGV
jgi:uncharacterized protein (TIGR03083 family)